MRNIDPVRFAPDLGVYLAACGVGSGVAAAAQHYHDSIISVLEKYAPMKLRTIRSNTAKPWHSDVIHGARQLRRQRELATGSRPALRSTESCM